MPNPTYPQPTCTHKPEDFSQSSINSGQRKINYALTVVDLKLIEVLKSLKDAVEKLSNSTNTGSANADITAASKAISEADALRKQVAEITPPGCDTNWPTGG